RELKPPDPRWTALYTESGCGRLGRNSTPLASVRSSRCRGLAFPAGLRPGSPGGGPEPAALGRPAVDQAAVLGRPGLAGDCGLGGRARERAAAVHARAIRPGQ